MNIEIHGMRDSEEMAQLIKKIWQQINLTLPQNEARECAVTQAYTPAYNYEGVRAYYLRVYSDRKSDFEVARAMLKPIRLPRMHKKVVECVLLADYWED